MTMITGTSVDRRRLTKGRKVKFTPAVLEQIKQWVQEGYNRHEIAHRLGTSAGSLQVTCSRLGIRLRRPKGRKSMEQSLATYSVNGHPISLTREEETNLAMEAAIRGIGIGELLKQIVIIAIEQHLVNEVKGGVS